MCIRDSFRGLVGRVNMRALILDALDDALGRHDLQQLERAGVTDVLLFGQGLVDLAHRGRSAGPEDLENRQLGRGGLEFGVLLHGTQATTKYFVLSTKVFVDALEKARTVIARRLLISQRKYPAEMSQVRKSATQRYICLLYTSD